MWVVCSGDQLMWTMLSHMVWIGAVGYIHSGVVIQQLGVLSGVVIQQLGVLSGVFTTQFEHKIIEIHYHI